VDRQETGTAVRKRAWFYYAVARLAVARNLAVALAIAAMCVGVVGLTLWAAGAKQRADAAAAVELSTLQQLAQAARPKSSPNHKQHINSAVKAASPSGSSSLFYTVHCSYKCGHQCSFIPNERSLGVKDVAGYKAKMEQMLCPACQAIADRRARQAATEKTPQGRPTDATH
jgi:hypothetical protein